MIATDAGDVPLMDVRDARAPGGRRAGRRAQTMADSLRRRIGCSRRCSIG